MEKDKSLFVQQCRELEKEMAGLEGDIAVDGVINPERYFDAPVHIMWVLKEGRYAVSYQEDINREDWRIRCARTPASTRRVVYASYGILKGEGENWQEIPESSEPQVYNCFLDIAWTNLKKTIRNDKIEGTYSDVQEVGEEYSKKYRDIVKRQVEIYDPDVVIFCGVVGKLIEVGGFPDLEKYPDDAQTEGKVCYWTSSKGKLYIDAYHPDYRGVTYEDYVMSVVNAYRKWKKA